MIETLSLRNFKVLREVDLKLQPFTLIVGPNASGKSSILEALEYFGHLGSLSEEKQRPPSSIRSRASRGELRMIAAGSAEGAFFDFDFAFKANRFHLEGLSGFGPFTGSYPPALHSVAFPVMLRFDIQKLAAPSYSKSVELSLPYDGEGLSSVLAGLQLEQFGTFNKIVAQLRVVVPGVENVRIKQALVDERVGFELRFDIKGAEDIPAWAISRGTLLTLRNRARRPGALSGGGPSAQRNAKRVLAALVQDADRERACWMDTELETLEERGGGTGLSAYLEEVRARLVPLFLRGAPG